MWTDATPILDGLCFSDHALRRCAQRAICPQAIALALTYGQRRLQEDGREVWHLTRRAARRAALPLQMLEAFLHTAVILARDGAVITVMRVTKVRRCVKARRQGKRRG